MAKNTNNTYIIMSATATNNNNNAVLPNGATTTTTTYHHHSTIILFYKYHPFTNDPKICETYRRALEQLCLSLNLTGRVLIGSSRNSEGINGTLAYSYSSSYSSTTSSSRGDKDGDDNRSKNNNRLRVFTYALIGDEEALLSNTTNQQEDRDAVIQFWKVEKQVYDAIGVPPLRMKEDDFKWSSTTCTSCTTDINNDTSHTLFPDLNIKLVKELIGTGGIMSKITIDDTGHGYLTPQQWHDELLKIRQNQQNRNSDDDNDSSNDDDTVIIDCRNAKEYEIGHFDRAIDPRTTTFNQFPKWVDDNLHLLSGKRVLMYCTGGIRCEKASAYIRQKHGSVGGVKDVRHLKGGIHKYLELYGGGNDNNGGGGSTTSSSSGSAAVQLWKGKNFVFDGRGAASAEETHRGRDPTPTAAAVTKEQHEGSMGNSNEKDKEEEEEEEQVVGRCVSCEQPYDIFHPHCVCTVCREPTLVCLQCQNQQQDCPVVLQEYHCRQHSNLRNCYFSNLDRFTSEEELLRQLDELQAIHAEIAIGRGFKQKRKTIIKQIAQVQSRLQELQNDNTNNKSSLEELSSSKCRNCGEVGCEGRCWGFYGLKRKEALERNKAQHDNAACSTRIDPKLETTIRCNGGKQPQLSKKLKRDYLISEIDCLELSSSPSVHRDLDTGIRVPPSTTRQLRCSTKAKWCGRPVVAVMLEEFSDLSRLAVIQQVLQRGLLRVNNVPVKIESASHVLLKSSDVISRIVHWHEAPVIVPDAIQVVKTAIPPTVVAEYGLKGSDDDFIYTCNKPASVPVHPAGPYFSNTLTMLVEAQEKLVDTLSLTPLHRTDRVTSGLTLCCTDPAVSRIFHKCATEGNVRKLYLAKVHGKFIEGANDIRRRQNRDIGTCLWREGSNALEVDVPVETVDPGNGIRAATLQGKPSKSLFRLLEYNPSDDTSTVACFPITGRNHQLRVHLQWLGFPIVDDIQYGGQSFPEQPQSESITQATVKLMGGAIRAPNDELRLPDISEDDIKAAKEACPCCNSGDGIANSFTPAQLLQGGHAICLHALQYEITIFPKKKQKDASDPLAILNFSVDPPTWVGSAVDVRCGGSLWINA